MVRGPRVGAQTSQVVAPPNKDGVEGEIVDRPSQASQPVEVPGPDDPRIKAVETSNRSAPGPATKSGPGEVAAAPAKELPVGIPPAMDIVGAAPKAPDAKKAEPINEVVDIPLPALPDEEKLDAKTKAKRKRFDSKTSKRVSRTAIAAQFSNADGSSTVNLGQAGSALDLTGQVVDEDAAFVSDGKGRVRKSAGLVRADLPETLVEGSEVVSLGVPGARIGFSVRRPNAQAGAATVPAAGVSSTAVVTATTSTIPVIGGAVTSSTSPVTTSTTTSTPTPTVAIRKQAVPISVQTTGSGALYKDVFGPGSDLRYIVNEGGVKEEIVLNSVPAVGDSVYRFPLNLDGFTARPNAVGSISFLDSKGKEQWVIPVATAWEQPLAGNRPSVYGAVGLAIEKNAEGGQDLVVRPDEKWLRDPNRKFPVIVDPTITPGLNSYGNAYGYVDSDYPATHLTQCSVYGTACVAAYSFGGPNHVAYDYLRYDTSPVQGSVINSASLKLQINSCVSYPANFRIVALSSPFDPGSITWSSRPISNPGSNAQINQTATTAGVLSVDVSWALAKYASGEWPSYGFQIQSYGNCEIRVLGPGASYLEVTYSAPGSNRQPSIPISQAPVNGASVSSPVTLSATSIDPDGDSLQYYFQGCKQPCATSGVTFDSGWKATNTWTFPTPVLGETWGWWAYAWDGVTTYVYNGGTVFTVGIPTATFQENWAWGTSPNYASISADNQPNAGVHTGTKRFVYSSTDAQVSWPGPALAITRTYNSADTTVGAFGLGWSSLFDARVDVDANSNVTFRLPDGRRQYHPLVGGLYVTQPGYWSTAFRDTITGGWGLLEKDGTTWRFNTAGQLVAVLDRNGRTLLLVYDAMQTKVTELRAVGYSSLRSLMITWTGNQITGVTDGLNQTWNYLYSGTLLSKSCDPRNNNTATGSCITYGYDTANRIASITKPGGNKDSEVGYYGDGTVQWRKDGLGNQWSYAYNAATKTSTTTDPLGRVTTEQYNFLDQLVLKTEPGDGNIASQTTSYTYDSNGFLAKSSNPVGSWEYGTDYRGNRYQVKDPTGAISYYKFDSRDLLIAYRDARSSGPTDATYLWTYGYDVNGNRVRETNPYGWSRTWKYDAYNLPGMMLQEVDWNGNATNYLFTFVGDVSTITYPGVTGDSVRYEYDALGRKIKETGRFDSNSILGITYTYDALNAPLTITEPPVTNPINGLIHTKRTTITYNANHLKASEVISDVGGSASPDPSRTTTYTYDLDDRQTGENGPLNKNSSQAFDAAGNVTQTTDPDGMQISTAFNARNLPQQRTVLNFVDPTTAAAATNKTLETMTYDGAGRMITNTDGLGRTRSLTYDGMNRLLTQTLNALTDRNLTVRAIVEKQLSYSAAGHKILEKTGSGAMTVAFSYDQAGRLYLQSNQSQPRMDAFTLDRNGNVTIGYRQTTGSITLSSKTTVFDARNRPTSITASVGGLAPNRTTTYTYTKFGTAATETGPRGGVTTYTYDLLGRASTVTAPAVSHEEVGGTAVVAGAVTTKAYDTFGNLTQERDARNAITTTSYDLQNRKVRVDYPACTTGCSVSAAFETWTYSAASQILTAKDRRGQTTTFAYDTLKRNVRVTLPQVGVAPAATRTTHFNIKGNATDTTNEVGAYTAFTYNEADQLRTSTLTDRFPATQMSQTSYDYQMSQTSYDYNDLGQRVWERDPLLNATTHEFLQTGEMTKTTDPIGAVTLAEYDALGRRTKTIDAIGRTTVTAYNNASEIVSVTRSFGGTTISTATSTYDNDGNLVTETAPSLNVKNYTYDLLNRRTAVQVPLAVGSITTTYGYDKNSNLTRVTDGKNAITTYTYNERNLQTSTIEPSTTAFPAAVDRTYTITYDAGGLPVSETKPGTTIARTFDPLAHPLTETWSGAGLSPVSKTYSVDAIGRKTQLASGVGPTYQYSYNDKNQLLLSKNAGDTANDNTFTYDQNGRLTAKTDRAGVFTFGYNARNELTTIADPLSGTRTQGYLQSGELSWVIHGGVSRFLGYSGAGPLLSSDVLKNSNTSAIMNSESYTYNGDDNLIAETNSGNSRASSHTYTYDKAGRLASWNNGSATVGYTYDGAGNRLTAGTSTFTFDARNRMLTGPSSTYAWTNRGSPVSQTVGGVTTTYKPRDFVGRHSRMQVSQTVGGVTTTYVTDSAERVTSASKPLYTATNTYDVLDRVTTRVAAGVTTYPRYSGFSLEPTAIAPASQIGFSSQFARTQDGQLLAETTGGVTAAVVLDRHGDAIVWYGTNGAAVTQTKQFDPFGAVTQATGSVSPLGFQGQFTDATTGDVNMGARWYNPAGGSFRGRDTIFGSTSSPATLNRYSYVSNNPLNMSDPTGHDEYNIDFSQYDLSWLADSQPSYYPPEVVSYEVANPSAGVYNYVENYSDGSSTIATVAPTGVSVSTPYATDRSGELAYTPTAAVATTAFEQLQAGEPAWAIAQSINDAYNTTWAAPPEPIWVSPTVPDAVTADSGPIVAEADLIMNFILSLAESGCGDGQNSYLDASGNPSAPAGGSQCGRPSTYSSNIGIPTNLRYNTPVILKKLQDGWAAFNSSSLVPKTQAACGKIGVDIVIASLDVQGCGGNSGNGQYFISGSVTAPLGLTLGADAALTAGPLVSNAQRASDLNCLGVSGGAVGAVEGAFCMGLTSSSSGQRFFNNIYTVYSGVGVGMGGALGLSVVSLPL